MKRTVAGEEYFTSPDLAERCVRMVDERFPMRGFDLVLEPSAGSGNFLIHLPPATRTGIDVTPRHDEIVVGDFLTWTPPPDAKRILTIGNPPFGRRGSLAVQFIHRACLFSDVVAFILPRSFNKYTFQDRVPLNYHLVDSLNCSDFLSPTGEPVEVNSVFQVWQKRPQVRELVVRPDSHTDFDMRHAHVSRLSNEELRHLKSTYEFAIPQVGSNFTPKDVTAVTSGSHWFIRPHVDGVRDRFSQLDFSCLADMNTAHTSLGKRDIVAAYIEASN